MARRSIVVPANSHSRYAPAVSMRSTPLPQNGTCFPTQLELRRQVYKGSYSYLQLSDASASTLVRRELSEEQVCFRQPERLFQGSPRELGTPSGPAECLLCSPDALPADSKEVLITQRSTSSAANETEVGDILCFACPIYFVKTEQGSVVVQVMRLGHLNGQVSVSFDTEDVSANAYAPKFEHASGTVIFEEGDLVKDIEVTLTPDSVWTPTVEFKVVLSEPWNCQLGDDLWSCRIKLMDGGVFPTNKYRSQIEASQNIGGGIANVSRTGLFFEFCKFVLAHPALAWRTIMIVCMDWLRCLNILLRLLMSMYMVDTLFAARPRRELWFGLTKGDARDHQASAWTLALLFILPQAFLHAWDWCRCKLDIDGHCKALVRRSVFRKYMNYSLHTYSEVDDSYIMTAIMDDCSSLGEAYVCLLRCSLVIGKLAVGLGFTLHYHSDVSWVPLAMGAIFFLIAIVTRPALIRAINRDNDCHRVVAGIVYDTSRNIELISNYFQRPQLNDWFAKAVDNWRQADVLLSLLELNQAYTHKWIGVIFTAAYIFWVTKDLSFFECILHHQQCSVESQGPSLGIFLATINIFGSMADDLGQLHTEAVSIQERISALMDITILLNKETDLPKSKAVYDSLLDMSLKERKLAISRNRAAQQAGGTSMFIPTDQIPIKVINMSFEYKPDKPIFRNVNLQLEQGKIAAIIGKHGSGKSTFLKLISRMFFPTAGIIFAPSHLRILHVSQKPSFLKASIWKNLVFGKLEGQNDIDPDRVVYILQRLGLYSIIPLIQDRIGKHSEIQAQHQNGNYSLQRSAVSVLDEETMDEEMDEVSVGEDEEMLEEATNPSHFSNAWLEPLTYAEIAKIHVARALIMNPEILVLQRPFYHYHDEVLKDTLASVLREHMSNRGLGYSAAEVHTRRPRTIIMSSEGSAVAEKVGADVIWYIDSSAANILAEHRNQVINSSASAF